MEAELVTPTMGCTHPKVPWVFRLPLMTLMDGELVTLMRAHNTAHWCERCNDDGNLNWFTISRFDSSLCYY